MFHNVNLSNLENVLQRNLVTDRARECTFGLCGGTNFENLPTWCQTWCHLFVLNVCTSLPQNTLDTSLMMSQPGQQTVAICNIAQCLTK